MIDSAALALANHSVEVLRDYITPEGISEPDECVRMAQALVFLIDQLRPSTTAVCKHCRKPIEVSTLSQRWVHRNEGRNISCRAASYNPDWKVNGLPSHDESLSRRWVATPT